MFLTLATTARNASDLGFLLQKHPGRVFRRDVGAGTVTVFYPEATADRCEVAVLLETDPVALAKRAMRHAGGNAYAAATPYVAGSLMGSALGRAFNTALAGRAKEKAERLAERWPLTVTIPSLPCHGGADAVRAAWGPLGYGVAVTTPPLDPDRPAWGDASTHHVTLTGEATIPDALSHLTVLLPALSGDRHFFVGPEEVEKIVRRGGAWLANHPAKEKLLAFSLKRKRPLVADALAQLGEYIEDDEASGGREPAEQEAPAEPKPRFVSLHEQRLDHITAVLADPARDITSVADLGCGEGKLIRKLLKLPRLARILGVDVSAVGLARTAARLHLDRSDRRDRVTLIQGSLVLKDDRLRGYDAAVLSEVVEHLDPHRLDALALAVLGLARPRVLVLTTPNREYNVLFETLTPGALRHPDHRFEWTREEFASWTDGVAGRFGYAVARSGVGEEDPTHGPPSQCAVFVRR